jgi:hypothetical protein
MSAGGTGGQLPGLELGANLRLPHDAAYLGSPRK